MKVSKFLIPMILNLGLAAFASAHTNAVTADDVRSAPPKAGPKVEDGMGPGRNRLDGGYSGGGGDRVRGYTDDAAWFYGKRRIRACQLVSPGFGKSPAETKAIIERAFRIWGDYLVEKKVHQRFSKLAPYTGITTALDFQAACDGSEDLKFYLGEKSAEVKEALLHYVRPTAIANRTDYDAARKWSRGFVWVAGQGELSRAGDREDRPSWKGSSALLGMILHEVGHILGCDHIPGTIMDERITLMIELAPDLSRIDMDRELYHCDECGIRLETYGKVSFESENDFDSEGSRPGRLSSKIQGRSMNGRQKIILEKAEGKDEYSLKFMNDETGSLDFETTITADSQSWMNAGQVFRTAHGFHEMHRAKIVFGRLKTARGEEIPVLLEYNMAHAWSGAQNGVYLRVSGFMDGKKAEIAEFRIPLVKR